MSESDAFPITLPAASPDSHSVRFSFENTYARLPEHFYARLNPTPVAAPRLVKVNVELARNLGLDPDALASAQGVEILAGNRVAEGAEPLAIAYAGHQFGYFVPQLGDGRANLLGEVVGLRRSALRHPAQGLRSDSLLPPRRRQSRARSSLARVHCQRGHGGAWRADHPCPGCGDHGRTSVAGNGPAWSRADPGSGEPPPRGHVPVLRRTARHGRDTHAGGLCDHPALP